MSETSADIKRLWETNDVVFRSPSETINYYSKWAKGDGVDRNYDMVADGLQYEGPVICAGAVAKYQEKENDIRILDVGAGTGRVAEELHGLGYTRIDAFDPSRGMLDVAISKNIYDHLYCAYWTDKVDLIKTDSYDALVTSGAFGEGHLKLNSIPEMIRVVKPGGLIVIVMREYWALKAEENKDRIDPYMDNLEKQGLWKKLERTVVKYAFGKNGLLYVYSVC